MKYKDFKHELKPFYDYEEEEADSYKYYNDFVYLMTSRRAELLFNLGLPVYEVFSNSCCLIRIKEKKEFKRRQFVCGVEKSVWQNFLHTVDGAAFVCAWYEISSITQSVRIKLEINKGKFTTEYYEYLHHEETYQMLDYFDERYKYFGKPSKKITSIKRNIRLYMPLVFEYADLLNDAFKEIGVTCFDIDYIASEIMVEFIDRKL